MEKYTTQYGAGPRECVHRSMTGVLVELLRLHTKLNFLLPANAFVWALDLIFGRVFVKLFPITLTIHFCDSLPVCSKVGLQLHLWTAQRMHTFSSRYICTSNVSYLIPKRVCVYV